MSKILDYAKDVFKIEAQSILDLSDLLTNDFEKAVDTISKSKGRVIITGMGKSGIIGRKIAATMASTGTKSLFLHPSEAYHGDLGMIDFEDIVIAISNSGETNEILKIVPFFKENENTIIAITGNPKSTLAQNSKYHLNVAVKEEACPLQLAPTSSTTATLAMGDALSVALMNIRNFKKENFARFHPGGNLGKKLLTTVESVMKKDNLPFVSENTKIKDVVNIMSQGRLGLAIVKNNDNLFGVITDGDIRRAMEESETKFFDLVASDIMTISPKYVTTETKLTEAESLFNKYKVNSLLVMKNENIVGVVQIYDQNIL